MTMKLTIRNDSIGHTALVCRGNTTLARLEPGQETEQYAWKDGPLTVLELQTEAPAAPSPSAD